MLAPVPSETFPPPFGSTFKSAIKLNSLGTIKTLMNVHSGMCTQLVRECGDDGGKSNYTY